MTRPYELPELAYDYSALEPHISGSIMELHHGKHHAGYVKNANAVLEQMETARKSGDLSRIASLERALAFHLSGHVLHSIFWRNLAPKAGGQPTGDLLAAIQESFGSFEAMQGQISAAAAGVLGSGWAALVWEPAAETLLVTQIYDHQSNVVQGTLPILVLDAWEHAYYLQYQNRKTEFFDAVWNLWNWDDIEARFRAARGLTLQVAGSAR